MPADWTTFITNVSNKLDGQTIQASYDSANGNVDDFATYLAQQYTNATVRKAQSPYGNTHQKGTEKFLIDGFSNAFKMLEKEKTPTFEDKKKDPKFADLKLEPEVKKLDEELDKFDLEFLAWTEDNASTIPDFVYSSFFSQFPNFPTTEDQQVTEVARRIISRFDGSSDYLQWIYTLKLQQDELADFSSKVYDKIVQLTQGLGQSEIKIGDEVQALALYPLDFRGVEDPTARQKQGDLLRGKVVSINTTSNFLGGTNTVYKINVQTSRGVVQRTVDPKTIQKKLNVQDFLNVRDLNLSRKILQESNGSDPERIPSFVTRKFITRFTYDPQNDKNLFSRILFAAGASVTINGTYGQTQNRLTETKLSTIVSAADLSSNVLYGGAFQSFLNGNTGNLNTESSFILNPDYLKSSAGYTKRQQIRSILSTIDQTKLSAYDREISNFLILKRRYVSFLAEKVKKDPDVVDPNDPYQIMADGVIKYWQSCLQQPLSASPPVPPCTILPPSNGIYVPLYYGSSKSLADNLRRAFNDGKNFNDVKTGKIVASSLAASFQKHLLELKFLYNGGIPTPGGPAPMVGFVSLVF